MPRGKVRWSQFYSWAGILRRDIGAMDLWEFEQAVTGWKAMRGVKPRGAEIADDVLAEMGIEGFD